MPEMALPASTGGTPSVLVHFFRFNNQDWQAKSLPESESKLSTLA